MATKRKNEDETLEERTERLAKEAVANYATRSEKTAWNRKHGNLTTKIEGEIHPLESQIHELQAKLQIKYDEVRVLREEMVDFCIHPFNLLVVEKVSTDYLLCKFCNKRLTNNQK